jgi:hypothetical protein
MAEEGTIKRQDVVDDSVLKLPKELADDFKLVVVQLDAVIQRLKLIGTGINQATTIPKVKKETDDLTESQKQLDQIQQQILKSTAKNNDEYAKQTKLLNEQKQALKDKITLGGIDAKTVTAQNSSITILGAALNKNRKAYEDLTNAQQRNSKEGKELKEIVEKQRESFVKLEKEVGSNKETVGGYREELEGLLVVQEGAGIEMEGLITKVRTLGKAFLTLLTNPIFLAFAALVVVIGAAKEAVATFFETSGEGEQVAERLKASYNAFFITAKKGFGDLGEKVLNVFGGENGINSLILNSLEVFSHRLAETYAKAAGAGIKLQKLTHELNEAITDEIIEKSALELKADQLTLESKDKLIGTDESRLELAKEAFKVRQELAASEKKLAEQQLEITYKQVGLEQGVSDEKVKELFFSKSLLLTEEQRRKIAEAIAEINIKQNDAFQQNRRLITEISSLQLDIEKKKRDAELLSKTTALDLRKAELDGIVKTNKAIIENDESTIGQRESALTQATAAEFEALERVTQVQKLQAQQAAAERLIAHKNSLQGDKAALQEALDADETFQKELTKIDTENQTQREQYGVEYTKSLQSILAKGYTQIQLDAKRADAEEIDALNVKFNAGRLSYNDYVAEVGKINRQSHINLVREEIKYQKDRVDKLKGLGQEYIIESKNLHDLEVTEAQLVADRKLKIEEKLLADKIKLAFTFGASVRQIGDNLFDAELQNNDARTKALKAHYDEEISQAGDNANLKTRLQVKYEADQKKLDAERVATEKRKAQFDKRLAEAAVVINTAQAVSKAVREFPETFGEPFAAFALIEGALQLAVIESTPLPQYAEGTLNAKGGWSIVGEIGTEMYVTPRGELGFTGNTAHLMDVEEGTKIYTHDQTMQALAVAGMGGEVLGNREDARVIDKLDEVKNAIKNSQPQQHNYVSNGLELLKVTKNKDGFTKIIKDITMGKWISE